MSAANVGLGPTLDRHYSDVGQGRQYTNVGIRCRPRPTLLRHFIQHRHPTSADADIAPTQRRRQPMPTLKLTSTSNVGLRPTQHRHRVARGGPMCTLRANIRNIDRQLQGTHSAVAYNSCSYASKLGRSRSQIVSRGSTEESSQDTTIHRSILHKGEVPPRKSSPKYWNQSCHVTQMPFNI